jgi:hypothetical protein
MLHTDNINRPMTYKDPVKRKQVPIGSVHIYVREEEELKRKIPHTLIMSSIEKLSSEHMNKIDIATKNGSFFYLAFRNDEKNMIENHKLINMTKMLKDRKDKIVILEYVDHFHTVGIMKPIGAEESHLFREGKDAFKCCYIESEEEQDQQEEQEQALTAQDKAESHYNQTERNMNTRHEAEIFHLRNLNNWIKMKLIEKSTELDKGIRKKDEKGIVFQYMYVCVYEYMYTCICICLHIFIYIYIYTFR